MTSAAVAAPTLHFRAFDNGVAAPALSSSSATGNLVISGATSNFDVVTGIANGQPLIAAPSFTVQTTTISSLTNFSGPATIRLEFSQTDVDSASAGGMFAALASTFTTNFLVNGATITSVEITSYADAGNAIWGTGTMLAQQMFTSAGASASPTFVTNFALNESLFSETIVIEAVYTAGGAALNTSAQLVAVPEPASLALFGGALLGLGLMRRRSRNRQQV